MEEGEEESFGRGGEMEIEIKEENEQQKGEEHVLRFLDSMDSYLILYDSLTSTLRQGWLELASAKHSMGDSRINSGLLDLKFHPAATSLQLTHQDNVDDSIEKQPSFRLCKWGNSDGGKCASSEVDKLQGIRHRGNLQGSGEKTSDNGALIKVDDKVQKERAKSLSVFGTLVSPKLRAAQLSFETVLETLVELANIRSTMLSSFDQVQKELEVAKRKA